MSDESLTREDYRTIQGILLSEREAGVENPLLPMDVDVNGDGIVDSFGLDENDRVIVIHGVSLEDTLYASEGEVAEESSDG